MSTTYVKADQIALQTDTPVFSYEELDYSDALRKDQVEQAISDLYYGFVDGTLNQNMDTMKEIYDHYSAADENTVSTYRLSVTSEILHMNGEFDNLDTYNSNLDITLSSNQNDLRIQFEADKKNHEDEYLELSTDYFNKTVEVTTAFNTVESVKNDVSDNWQSTYMHPYSTDFYSQNNRMSDEVVRLNSEQDVVKANMDLTSTTYGVDLDTNESLLNSRNAALNTELDIRSNNVLNAYSNHALELQTMVTGVITSELELSHEIEAIILGSGVDGAAKYNEISNNYVIQNATDDALYAQLNTAVTDYKNTTTAQASTLLLTQQDFNSAVFARANAISYELLDVVISDVKVAEDDLSNSIVNMNELVGGLDAKLITYNASIDITNDNLVAAKNICIGNNWRFKTDETSLYIEYNGTPSDSTAWQTVPFLKHSNTANAEQLLLSNVSTPIAHADKPSISDSVILANSIINNGPEDRSVLRGVVHQLLHNVQYNSLIVGDNVSTFLSNLNADPSATVVLKDSNGTSLSNASSIVRVTSDGLLFVSLDVTDSGYSTSITGSFTLTLSSSGNSDVSVTAYYFPFVMDAENIN